MKAVRSSVFDIFDLFCSGVFTFLLSKDNFPEFSLVT